MTSTTSRSKKILAPLAVLLAAGALAVGSGATFTAATDSSIETVTSGSLTLTNGGFEFKDGLANLQPGQSRTGSVTVKNEGSLPADLTLKQVNPSSTFTAGVLTLEISQAGVTTPIYSGEFQKMDSKTLGSIDANSSKDFQFTVALDKQAGNTNQGKNAKATFAWDAVQIDN